MSAPSGGFTAESSAISVSELEAALANDEFQTYIQFVYDVRRDCFVGVEALSRWMHPERGLIFPGQYIGTLFSSGLISRLDYQMLEKSCRLLEAWNDSGLCKLRLSCNFARVTLGSPEFFPKFLEIVGNYRFDYDNLILELTEDSLSDRPDLVLENVISCKEMGFRVALDDLGAGCTSFNDLCDFPLDVIKVDRHIVQRAVTSRGRSFLRELIKLAHHLGIGVICEGVETEDERAAVRDAGCDYVQGFFYSRALPVDRAMEEYRRQLPDPSRDSH